MGLMWQSGKVAKWRIAVKYTAALGPKGRFACKEPPLCYCYMTFLMLTTTQQKKYVHKFVNYKVKLYLCRKIANH